MRKVLKPHIILGLTIHASLGILTINLLKQIINMEYQLTKIQQRFGDLIESTDGNYFINGKPGVGKSVLTRWIDTESRKQPWTVCAPTGLAALNAGGQTLHRLFRLPISEGIIPGDYNRWPDDRALNNIRYNVKRLLIDEISMVRCDTLDYIDRLLRYAKGRDLPFGGIQVVVVGDFYQLAPIVKAIEKKQLVEEGYDSPYAFSAKVWSTFTTLTLDEVLRQKGDRAFIDLLHSARTATKSQPLHPKYMVELNARVQPRPKDLRVTLCAWNSQAENINMEHLGRIKGPVVEFEANTFGDWPAFPCEPELKLKPGAQVMVKLNGADRPPDHEGRWESDVVNGTLGYVLEIYQARKGGIVYDEEEPNGYQDDRGVDSYVSVETRSGKVHKIYWAEWTRKVKEKGPDGWDEKVVARFEQIPLALSWAISMHKSQGQTFEAVHLDASKIFAAGMFYVALSRCTTLEGVTLESRINQRLIYSDPQVTNYFQTCSV
jgi:ATP-dependent DNA helicase PIF1